MQVRKIKSIRGNSNISTIGGTMLLRGGHPELAEGVNWGGVILSIYKG